MKRILLIATLGLAALLMSSCFGRDCVCKEVVKRDGDKVSKSKEIYFDLTDKEKDECKDMDKDYEDGDDEYKIKCR